MMGERLHRIMNEYRLGFALWLIGKAVEIAPSDHPDSHLIYQGALRAAGWELDKPAQ